MLEFTIIDRWCVVRNIIGDHVALIQDKELIYINSKTTSEQLRQIADKLDELNKNETIQLRQIADKLDELNKNETI